MQRSLPLSIAHRASKPADKAGVDAALGRIRRQVVQHVVDQVSHPLAILAVHAMRRVGWGTGRRRYVFVPSSSSLRLSRRLAQPSALAVRCSNSTCVCPSCESASLPIPSARATTLLRPRMPALRRQVLSSFVAALETGWSWQECEAQLGLYHLVLLPALMEAGVGCLPPYPLPPTPPSRAHGPSISSFCCLPLRDEVRATSACVALRPLLLHVSCTSGARTSASCLLALGA